jgi:NADH-quinone oxidoreductase subunit J
MSWAAFIFLTVLAVGSAVVVAVPVVRSSVLSALALVLHLVAIAAFFFLLDAQFVGFLQVIVYAGAIMVLILFVLMLLNVRDEQTLGRSGVVQRWLAPLLAVVFAGILVGAVTGSAEPGEFPAASAGFGTVGALGLELFGRFFYPFEAISLLLVVAMVGAVLLAKRRL